MAKRRTSNEFIKEVFDLYGEEYEVIGTYVNATTKVDVIHKPCGNILTLYPSNFLRGHRCKHCANNVLKTPESFKEEVFKLVGDEYTFLEDYINARTKILVRHNDCGHVYPTTPNKFKSGRRCPSCFGKKKSNTQEFKTKVYQLVKDEYTVLGEYLGTDHPILMRHNTCGRIYSVTPHCFTLRGNRCSACQKCQKKTTEQFKKEVYDIVGDEFEVVGEYISANSPILIKHHVCGHTHSMTPSSFLRGNRCKTCKQSKGAKEVARVLTNLKLNFVVEYTFHDCRNERLLPFDFCLLNSEKEVVGLIEFDGKHHYEVVVYGSVTKERYRRAYSDYRQRRRNDQIKTNYCLRHHIPLLRIPYWEQEQIESLVQEWLKQLPQTNSGSTASM